MRSTVVHRTGHYKDLPFLVLAAGVLPPASEDGELVIGSEEEAAKALLELQSEAAAAIVASEESIAKSLLDYVNPEEANDLAKAPLSAQEMLSIDFSMQAHVSFRERVAVSEYLEQNRAPEVDLDDVLGTDLTQLAKHTWELVPAHCTVPMFGTAQEIDNSPQSFVDKPFEGKPPSDHPMEQITTRVRRGRFDPMRNRDMDYRYPEFTDLYANRLDPEISVYLITDDQWEALRHAIIHPVRLDASTPALKKQPFVAPTSYPIPGEFYPIPIPHDFDLSTVPEPADDEVCHGVPLKQYLTHPYDWHIFRASLSALRQDEVDRIVHIGQSMLRKHKPRITFADNLWWRFTVRLTSFDHAQDVPKTLEEERVAMPFYKGRRHLTEFFHRHHKRLRADKLTSDFVEEALKRFHPEDVARQRRYKDFLAEDRLAEEIRVQTELQQRIEAQRMSYKWYLAPWYMLQAMFYH